MGASTKLEFLPADIVGLSPLARAALGGELSVPGVTVARAAGEIVQPRDRFDSEARAGLAERLEEASGCVSPPIAVLESIRALREPGACAVMTGQQPGLTCGPLYSVWKGLQAVAVARQLSEDWGTPVVPMFWNHADDHDIAEVHHTWLVNRNLDLQKVGITGMSSGRQPFSRIILDEDKNKLAALKALAREVHGDHLYIEEAIEALTPRDGESVARAFTRGMTALLGRYGLVVFEPDWLRDDLSAALGRIVGGDAPADLARGEADLLAAGHEVALPSAEAALVYHVGPEGRRPLRPGGEGYQYDGESGSRTAAELAAEIVQEPEAWSAGALLRPLVQDAALPVCAYVGGWGELAYQAQLGQLRKSAGVPETAFIPRLSVSLTDSDIRASLETLGCSVADILEAKGEWRPIEEEGERPAVLDDLHALAKKSRADLLGQRAALSELDPRLAASLERAAGQVQEKVEKVAKKAERVHANQSGHGRRRERRANHTLSPHGHPQERTLGPLPFVAKFGFDWLGELLEELDPFAPEHVHCALNEPPKA
jgi:bacillithiol biosynthesis cysteine-adding enzyme BshC